MSVRTIGIISAAAALLVIVIAVVALNSGSGGNEPAAAAVPGPSPTATVEIPEGLTEEELQEYLDSIAGMDAETLAGLRGDESAFQGDMEEGDLIKIAVLSTHDDDVTDVLRGVEEYSGTLLEQGLIDDFAIYASSGDSNQLIQDMRAVINRNCDAVIIAGLPEYEFGVVSRMAQEAGIPVAAYDAPVEGYSFNVTRNSSDSLSVYAGAVAESGAEGVVFLSDKADSTYSKEALRTIRKEVPAAAAVYTESEDYIQDIAAQAPRAVIAKGSVAARVYAELCANGLQPELFCADATAGLLDTWYRLGTTGIPRSELYPQPTADPEAAADPEATAEPDTEPEPTAAAEPDTAIPPIVRRDGGDLMSGTTVSYKSVGRLLMRSAMLLAKDCTPVDGSGTGFGVLSEEFIEESNVYEYYADAKDADADELIYASIAPESADELFSYILRPVPTPVRTPRPSPTAAPSTAPEPSSVPSATASPDTTSAQ